MNVNLPEFLSQDEHGLVLLTGHRIALDDVLYCYNEGFSAEMILGQFPTLSLAQIHNVIAFYLENQGQVEAYLEEETAKIEKERAQSQGGSKLLELRKRMQAMHQAEVS
ncbi:MAG: DUF433 domain-containing protein [Planctomycetota bacterium]|nr:DUF433 domain-containing protein [Planctomycetota bacterium]MDA1139965.1 DUF433 domain-containing protein [Planctomycetota bacterium]